MEAGADDARAANVPRQKQLEAIRGAILARQSGGLPLLLEQLRSPDKALFGIGLRTARELPGRDVTEALAAELRRCSPDRQPFLLLALADRSDAAVLPAVLEAAAGGSQKLRLRPSACSTAWATPPASRAAECRRRSDAGKPPRRSPSCGNEMDADLWPGSASAGKNRQVLISGRIGALTAPACHRAQRQ
jgi:hypothetical protein